VSGVTLDIAQRNLDAWIAASEAAASGNSYRIGTRQLTRENATEIRNMIAYWERRVEELAAAASGINRRGARVMRVIPRDL
jgi:hypothetical protein